MSEKIILIEDIKILSNNAEVAECFNKYFYNIKDRFETDPIFKEAEEENLSMERMVLRAINKYKDHPSIRVINQHLTSDAKVFQFSHVNPSEVMRQIDLLDTNKSSSGYIPTRILKAMKDKVCPYLTD